MSIKRTVFLFCFMLSCFTALIFRLYDIAENKAEIYAAETTNSYRVILDKSRGMIYDRNVEPLVSNEKRYKVAVLPSIQSKSYLHSVLSTEEFEKINQKFAEGKPFTFETENYIAETNDVKIYLIRKRYSDNPLAVHFIGYCDPSLTNGISGIEKAYDDVLSAQSATLSLSYPIDAAGRALTGVEPTVSAKGYKTVQGIALTLDTGIQKIAESAAMILPGNGSILITDVQNGEVLAGVSMPEYNRADIASSINSNDSALLNRNLCAYNIGSTYKLIVSAAALSKGISSSFSHNCSGNLEIDEMPFHCHKEDGHGFLNMKTAFANSCNPYFIRLGLTVGKERLISMSSAMGLGKPITLCDGIATAAGNLPSADEIGYSGDLANISFGQGALMATPVHIAKLVSIIANGGYLVEPSLIYGEVNADGNIIRSQSTGSKTRVLNSEVAEAIQQYMIYTVTAGTGRSAAPKMLGAGGKTASAETGWAVNGETLVQAWFSGFYPANKPKYAIVVLCEGGNSGAASCGPVFKKICDLLYENGYCN